MVSWRWLPRNHRRCTLYAASAVLPCETRCLTALFVVQEPIENRVLAFGYNYPAVVAKLIDNCLQVFHVAHRGEPTALQFHVTDDAATRVLHRRVDSLLGRSAYRFDRLLQRLLCRQRELLVEYLVESPPKKDDSQKAKHPSGKSGHRT